MTVRATVICLVLWVAVAVLSNGCLAPPIIFPQSGGSGKVVDQDNNALTNATVKASWLPYRLIPFIADSENRNIPVESDGSWSFYKRKVVKLHIRAYAPYGYEPWIANNGLDLYSGQSVTNVVFQFHKIHPVESPKESK